MSSRLFLVGYLRKWTARWWLKNDFRFGKRDAIGNEQSGVHNPLVNAEWANYRKNVFVKDVSLVTSTTNVTMVLRERAGAPPAAVARTRVIAAGLVRKIKGIEGLTGMASAETSITIAVNGREVATSALTLAVLLVEQGYDRTKVATALNEEFVPERLRAATTLRPGDKVEVLSVRQGG